LTDRGWSEFEKSEFEEAWQSLQQAIQKDPEYGEAYNAVGWCCAKLDSLEEGLEAFDQAISKGVSSADPRAGKAVIHRDLDPVSFQSAIDWADSALAVDSNHVFSHDESFDWKDLRLVLAQSYYGLSRYDKAHAQVDILNPSNSLDRESPSYVEDLLAEIERLGEQT
jgi:tetratricopeptide (TPR) repeat protein